MQRFTSAPQFDGYSKVVIIINDEIEYTAGNDTGRTLRITNPWGTPQMAQDILNKVRGFQYQPYTAEGALLDPSVELGDGVTANNVYGGIYTQKIRFGPLLTATVAAPEDEELNHEYPYKSKPNKEITREAKMLRASLAIEAGRITAEIEARVDDVADLNSKLTVQANLIATEVSERKADSSELRSSIKQESNRITAEINIRSKETASIRTTLDLQAGQISAKVSKTGGSASSFGWDLTDTSWTIKANSREILKATVNGLEVYGKVTATSGKIGGFDIQSSYLSYNNQSWGGTNRTGIYIGINGIQCGPEDTGVQITNYGYLYAEHGEFRGTVRAGNIDYGGNAGYLSGEGINTGSIYGNRLVGGTVSTAYTSSGINASLGRGDAAYNVVTGVTTAAKLFANEIQSNGKLSGNTLFVGGYSVTTKSVSFKDKDGNTVNINYWGWA